VRPRRGKALAAVLAAGVLGVGWALAAHALWHSSVPAGVRLPHLHAREFFAPAFLARSASFDRFLEIELLLEIAALVVVLALYARRGHALMRESAAGRVGTGILLGMLGFALAWLTQAPFGLVAVWWERRHHISNEGYVSSLLSSFLGLGARFIFIALALLLAMGIAGYARRLWWALAAPAFVGLALLFAFVSPYLIANTSSPKDPTLNAEAASLARTEGVPGTKVLVQNVHRYTTAPNAEAAGFGATRRLILWDTLLDGRFTRGEVRVVIAHELGHIAHGHTLRRVGWLALFLIPMAALIALATRARGGMARPEAVPVALFVYVVLQLVTLPLWNIVSRHEEAEADWSALRATRDPASAQRLFEELARTSLADPDPPSWSYVLSGTHPTIMQRIAMVHAWAQREGVASR
jgi:STE24 endopeptidase